MSLREEEDGREPSGDEPLDVEGVEGGSAAAERAGRSRGSKRNSGGGIDLAKLAGGDDEGPADAPQDAPDGEARGDVTDDELERVRPIVAVDSAVAAAAEDEELVEEDDGGEEGAGDDEDGSPRGEAKAGAPVDLGLRAAVEAVVFAADEAVTPAQVAKAIGAKPSKVKRAILEIQERLDATGSGLMLQELAGGFIFTTHAEHAPAIRALRKTSSARKLSPAAVDTLAIIAYKQPAQRQEIEDIRGVASCGPMLRQLMQLDLVKIVGRAEVLGKPLLYGTTKRFLDMFGLATTKDLPKVSELEPK